MQMAALTDDIKQFLNENYWRLSFVDDIKNVQCVRCKRVALNHRLAKCEHIFCFKCNISITNKQNCKCYKCGSVIILTEASDKEVENKICNLKVLCPNYKHECEEITELYKIQKHLKVCKKNKNVDYFELQVSIKKIEDDLIQLKNEIKNEFEQQSDFLNKISTSINEIFKKLNTINNEIILNLKTYFEDRMTIILQEILTKLAQQTKDIESFVIESCKQKSSHFEERKSQPAKVKVFNAVLLGEKGCGKTSFANLLSSCIPFKTFHEARNHEITSVAKTSKKDEETPNAKKFKSYNILVKDNCSLRIFESPALRYDKSEKNKNFAIFKKIFNYIQTVKNIHSIFLVLNIDELQFTQHLFEGIRQTVSNLHQSSAQNFVFIFTHCKDQNKVKIIQSLRELLANYSTLIKINEENAFFFENEEFANLFNDDAEVDGEIKWQQHASEANRLANFVLKLPANDIGNIISVIENKVLLRDIGMMLGNVSQSINEKKNNLATIVRDENRTIKLNNEKRLLIRASKTIKQYLNSNSIVENACISTSINNEDDVKSIKKQLIMMDTYGERFRSILRIEEKSKNQLKRFSFCDSNNNLIKHEQLIERVSGKEMPKRCLNFIFLGETGKGKSTLINAFANYSLYSTFAEACLGPEVCPIPTKFTFSDEDYNEIIIQAGSNDDLNEKMSVGQLGTQSCKSYRFSISDKFDVRLIDSSGFGSSNGPEKDTENVRDVMSYVEQFEEIHAVAVVLNSNQARVTDEFHYSLQQVLSIFHKSAASNFIFVFTHGKTPKDALQTVNASLELIARSAPEAELIKNLNKKNNIFSFENNVFQNLVAKEMRDKEVNFEIDWKSNAAEFSKMIEYVANLKSHDFSSTIKVHKITNYLNIFNLMIDSIKTQKQNLIDNSDRRKQLELMEIEEESYLNAAIKSFSYIKSNSLLFKNLKLVDYSKQFSNYFFEDIERHLPKNQFGSAYYNEICDIVKKLILLEVSGTKFESLLSIESKSQNQFVNKNRDQVISKRCNTI